MPPKKAAKKHAPPPGKDLRRAWEHLGRTEKLLVLLDEAQRPGVIELVQAARSLVQTGPATQAADLLRAAEHLAFACIDTGQEDAGLPSELVDSIKEEFEHLSGRADGHWEEDDRTETVARTYARMRKDARTRMKQKRYGQALEFARGAEALTHVHGGMERALPTPARKKALKTS